MAEYKAYRTTVVGKKPKWVVEDENGNIVDGNPDKEKLRNLETKKREKYTNNELLRYLKKFYNENNRVPKQEEFLHNPKYPSFFVYIKRFGSWSNALKMVGLYSTRKGTLQVADRYKELTICNTEKRPRWVIVDKNGDTINWNPSKEELIDLEIFKRQYRGIYKGGNICPRCKEEKKVTERSVLHNGNVYLEKDKRKQEDIFV